MLTAFAFGPGPGLGPAIGLAAFVHFAEPVLPSADAAAHRAASVAESVAAPPRAVAEPDVPDVATPPRADDEPDAAVVVRGPLGAELDALLTGCVPWGFSGTVLVADADGVVLQRGYGAAIPERGVACGPSTRYDIASVSKYLTAIAVLRLAERGGLALDDPIRDHMPGVPAADDAVTIHHLLTHTSGFPRMGPTGDGRDIERAVRAYLAGGRVREPGTAFEYWNGGYALLAMIVERVHGAPFPRAMRDLVFEPAGMTESGFCQESFPPDVVAHGSMEGQSIGPATGRGFDWGYRGMGGVVTSTVDLHRLHRALQDGVLLEDPGAVLERPFLGGHACGAWVDATVGGGPLVMASGNVAGFNSTYWRFPDEDVAIAILCNTPQHAMVLGMHVAQRLQGQPGFLPEPPPTVELDAAGMQAFTGRFTGPAGTVVIESDPSDPSGLRVAGEGQATVSMLLTGDATSPPSTAERVASAASVLDGAIAGDFAPLGAVMDPSIPADWPRRFAAYWADHERKHGPVVRAELIGARPTARSPMSLRMRYRLHHEAAVSLAELHFEGAALQAFVLEADGPFLEIRYVPSTPTTLARYSVSPGPNVTIERTDTGVAIRSSFGAIVRYDRDPAR